MKPSVFSVTLLFCLASLVSLGFAYQRDQSKWVTIFDGKTLDGWTPKIVGYKLGDDPLNTFRVEDGKLVVNYDQYGPEFKGRYGHLFYKTPLSNFRLRLEYRFVGDQVKGAPGWAWRNNGIMYDGEPAASMGLDQSYPVSMEFQLLGGDGSGNRPTGNLCTPGTNYEKDGKVITQHCTNSTSPTLDGDQWVTAELEVRGTHVKHYINGKLVFEYDNPQLDPNDADGKALIKDGKLILTGGTVSLQSESHPTEFRNIEIMSLD
ncbi:MAG TPA: DUF1080 domain-containing protein [Fimbriimonadaceae bacterium]|nr:DUF1080 domain-containing protein [Fimbriimonadaceae bacterium]